MTGTPFRLDVSDAARYMFGRFPDDTLVGTAQPDLSSDGALHPKYYRVVQVGQLEELMPSVAEALLESGALAGYWLANGLDPSADHPYHPSDAACPLECKSKPATPTPTRRRRRRAGQISTRSYFHASDKHVRELGTLYVDLDVGRADDRTEERTLTAGQAIGAVFDLADEGAIPWPTIAIRTGRGLNLLWLLVDRDIPEGYVPKPPIPWPAPVNDSRNWSMWQQITRQLQAVLAPLGADVTTSTTATARWLKMPDSTIAKTDARDPVKSVDYLLFMPRGAAPTYTLEELFEFFDLWSARPPRRPYKNINDVRHARQLTDRNLELSERERTLAGESRPDRKRERGGKKTRGQASAPRWAVVYDIEAIANHRKQIEPGVRHLAAWYLYQNFLHATLSDLRYAVDGDAAHEIARARADEMLSEFNRKFCRPQLTAGEIAWAKRIGRQRARSATIARDLGITAQEAAMLGLRTLIPAPVAAAERKKTAVDRAVTRSRQSAIDEMIVAGLGDSDIARQLNESRQRVRYRRQRLLARGVIEPVVVGVDPDKNLA